MSAYRRNQSGQFLYFGLVSALSGNPVTGQSGGISGRRSIDGGSMTLLSGFVGEVAGGQYVANLFDFDLNGNNIGFLFTASGCVPVNFTVITDNNVSGRIGIVSGTQVNVWSGQLSGYQINVHSGQLSGQPISLLSGRSWTASGIFAVATAEVASGTLFLASGSVILPSGGLVGLLSGQSTLVYSGQLSGQPISLLSGRSWTASGIFAVATAEVASGTLFLASGSVILPSGGQVSVFSGTLHPASGMTFIASGPFVNATATVASGQVWLASGSVILPSGGLVGLLSGQFVNVYSGQLSGHPVSPSSGVTRTASGSTVLPSGGLVGVLSGQNVNVYSGQLSGQHVNLLSGNQVGVWSGSSVNVFSGSMLPDIFDADGMIESGLTFRQAIRLTTTAAAGELSGAGTSTIRIRNPVADFKTRITATVDASGNRTAITYDLT